jgi:hypothetical protein
MQEIVSYKVLEMWDLLCEREPRVCFVSAALLYSVVHGCCLALLSLVLNPCFGCVEDIVRVCVRLARAGL